MELRPGYKKTEVGVIPEEWDVVPMHKIAPEIGDGLHGTPVYSPNGAYYFVNGNNLRDGRLVITDDTRAVDYGEYKRNRKNLNNQSILMSINGTIGNLAFFEGEAVVLGKSAAYLNVQSEIDKRFVYFLLQTENVKRQFSDGLTGSTIGNLGLTTIRNTKVPFPPIQDEQRAIAKTLSDIDALLDSLDQLITKKRNLKQAAMQQLLTGKTRLPGFVGEWEVKRLGDVVEIRKGQLITEKDAVVGNVPVIGGGKNPSYFHNSPNRTGKTITISASGASAGYVAFFDMPIFASDCSTISEDKQYSIEFIYFQLLLNQCVIFKAQTGGAQPHIHAVDLVPVEIGIPSLPEQTAIASVLSDMDAEIEAIEQRRSKTHHLKQAMMQELLTGKTRLVDPIGALR